MYFKEWLLFAEGIQGGIRPVGGNAYKADYEVQTDTGARKFNAFFSYGQDGSLHINWLGGDMEGDKSISILSLMQHMAQDVCQNLGPISDISYTPSGGPLKSGSDGSAVRERLFNRYIKQLKSNLPPTCTAHSHNPLPEPRLPGVQNRNVAQPSRYASHPMRGAFKGTDDEFAQWFGVK